MSLYGGVEITNQPDFDNIRKLDKLPTPAIMEMMRTGIAIDMDHFHQLSTRLGNELDEARSNICSYIPPERLDQFANDPNIDSTQQLSKLLYDVLGIGKGKRLKTTKSGDQISTGKKQLEQLKREHEVIPELLAYKERSKLKSAFADSIPQLAKWHPRIDCWCGYDHDHWECDGVFRVHTDILTTRTTTGRPASKSPNLQQIPARTELGLQIRAGFIATPGMELVSADFSQLELRILAHRAQAQRLIWIFENDRDAHTQTAIWAFDLKDESQVDKILHRAPAKNVGFALVYGETVMGLYEQMLITFAAANMDVPDWFSKDWCADFFDRYHGVYPEVQPYMDHEFYKSRRYGIVWGMFGRVRRIPEVRSVHQRVMSAGLRQAGNHAIQNSGSDMLKLAIAQIQDEVVETLRSMEIPISPLMIIHDEWLGEVCRGMGETVGEEVERIMGDVLKDKDTGENRFTVPIKAESKVMDRWEKD